MAIIAGQRLKPSDTGAAPRAPRGFSKGRRNFVYTHNPLDWAWIDGEWTPNLRMITIDPGVGGVGGDGRNPDTSLAETAAHRAGRTVIRPTDPRLGEFRDYVVKVPTQGRQSAYISIFETVKNIGGQAFAKDGDTKDPDNPYSGRYREFCRYLVEAGIIPDITAEVREAITARQAQTVDNMRNRAAANPQNQILAARLKAAEATLDAMRGVEPVKRSRKGA